jgi:hypothetical protein
MAKSNGFVFTDYCCLRYSYNMEALKSDGLTINSGHVEIDMSMFSGSTAGNNQFDKSLPAHTLDASDIVVAPEPCCLSSLCCINLQDSEFGNMIQSPRRDYRDQPAWSPYQRSNQPSEQHLHIQSTGTNQPSHLPYSRQHCSYIHSEDEKLEMPYFGSSKSEYLQFDGNDRYHQQTPHHLPRANVNQQRDANAGYSRVVQDFDFEAYHSSHTKVPLTGPRMQPKKPSRSNNGKQCNIVTAQLPDSGRVHTGVSKLPRRVGTGSRQQQHEPSDVTNTDLKAAGKRGRECNNSSTHSVTSAQQSAIDNNNSFNLNGFDECNVVSPDAPYNVETAATSLRRIGRFQHHREVVKRAAVSTSTADTNSKHHRRLPRIDTALPDNAAIHELNFNGKQPAPVSVDPRVRMMDEVLEELQSHHGNNCDDCNISNNDIHAMVESWKIDTSFYRHGIAEQNDLEDGHNVRDWQQHLKSSASIWSTSEGHLQHC